VAPWNSTVFKKRTSLLGAFVQTVVVVQLVRFVEAIGESFVDKAVASHLASYAFRASQTFFHVIERWFASNSCGVKAVVVASRKQETATESGYPSWAANAEGQTAHVICNFSVTRIQTRISITLCSRCYSKKGPFGDAHWSIGALLKPQVH
jgi:hypothetical protein